MSHINFMTCPILKEINPYFFFPEDTFFHHLKGLQVKKRAHLSRACQRGGLQPHKLNNLTILTTPTTWHDRATTPYGLGGWKTTKPPRSCLARNWKNDSKEQRLIKPYEFQGGTSKRSRKQLPWKPREREAQVTGGKPAWRGLAAGPDVEALPELHLPRLGRPPGTSRTRDGISPAAPACMNELM